MQHLFHQFTLLGILFSALCSVAEVSLPLNSDWQGIVNTQPAGTTYRIASGVHRLQSVVPKPGDRFLAQPDAIMKGSKVIAGAQQDPVNQLWYFNGQDQDLLWYLYNENGTRGTGTRGFEPEN